MPKTFKFCDGNATSVCEEYKALIVKTITSFQAFNSRRYQFIQDKGNAPGKTLLNSNLHPLQKKTDNYFVSYNPEYTNKKFIYFCTINGVCHCFDIQDRGNKTNVQQSKICEIKFRVNPSWYKGTLLCGNTMKNKVGKWMFLIEDIWMSDGKTIADRHLFNKFKFLHDMLKSYIPDSSVEVCKMIPIELFPIYDLPRLFTSKANTNYPINGFVFYPCKIGVRYLFIINNNELIQRNCSLSSSTSASSASVKSTVNLNISKVQNTHLADQYMMHCLNKTNNKVFIGYVEVPNKENRLKLYEMFLNQDDIILPCTYNVDLEEWIITSIDESKTISSVDETRELLRSLI